MQFTPTQKRTLTWSLFAALAVLALWLLGAVLTPFVVAAVLAYALTPMVNKLDNLGNGKLPRVLAVLIVQTVFGLLVLSILKKKLNLALHSQQLKAWQHLPRLFLRKHGNGSCNPDKQAKPQPPKYR